MLRVVRRITAPFGLALVMALAFQGSALAATVNVSIVDYAFSPAIAKPKQGDMVLWTNTGNQPHTTSSDGCFGTTGVALWCSPTLNDNDTFSQVFSTAAKYPYFCGLHPSMQGTVQVNMKGNPKNGGVGTTFNIIWAKGSVPSTFNADIQIKRPSSTQFVDWMINRTGNMVSAQFQPDDGTGVYQFRSRLQKGTGGASDYSKVTKITVF